jgi:hypothetical protein
LKDPIKKRTLRRGQLFEHTRKKNTKTEKYAFKFSLSRPIILGLGKMISSVL